MVLLRSACLVLGLLLLSSLALRDSGVHAQQDMAMVTKENENGIAETGVDAVFVSKELFEGVAAAATNKRLGGRKLMQNSTLMKNMREEEEAVIGKTTPKISGKDKNASKKPFGTSQKYMNDQESSNVLKLKALTSEHSARKQNPGSKPADDLPDNMASQLKSQDSEAVSYCGSLECSSTRKLVLPEFHTQLQKTESKKLLEVTNDIESLLHKDYASRPHCKPPINNHQPSRQSVKP